MSQGWRGVLCLTVLPLLKFTLKPPQDLPTLVKLSVDISCRDSQGSAISLEATDASAGKPMASQAVLISNSCKQIRQRLKQESFMATAAILTLDKSHTSKVFRHLCMPTLLFHISCCSKSCSRLLLQLKGPSASGRKCQFRRKDQSSLFWSL